MLISYGNNLYTSTMHMHTIRTYPYFGSRCPHFVNVYIKCVLYMCTNHNPIGYKLIIKPKSFVSINVCAYHLCLDIMLPPRRSLSLSFLVQSFLKWLLILAGHKSLDQVYSSMAIPAWFSCVALHIFDHHSHAHICHNVNLLKNCEYIFIICKHVCLVYNTIIWNFK